MTQEQARQLKAGVTGDTYDSDLLRMGHFLAYERFNSLLQGLAGLAVRCDDQDGVVSGYGASDFWEFGGVHRGSQGLRGARRRFQYQQVFRRTYIGKKFAESSRQRRQAGGVFREDRSGLVALVSLDQSKLLQIAGKRGLGDAQLLS